MEDVFNRLKRDLAERCWDMIINNLPAGEWRGSCIVHGDIIQVLAAMKIVAHGLKTNIKVNASTPDAKVVKE
jgi:hypothetical protein